MNQATGKGVYPDGEKIKELRKREGYSQKNLASKINITVRTLQRAEKGDRVMPEVVSTIASFLRVPPANLQKQGHARDGQETQPGPLDDPHHEIVRLQRMMSATKLAERARYGNILDFQFHADPDEELADKIAEAVEIIEALRESRDRVRSTGSGNLSNANRIREIGRLNTIMKALAESCVYFFIGGFWRRRFYRTQMDIQLSSDESVYGDAYVAEVESYTVFRITHDDAQHIVEKVHVGPTDEEIDKMIAEKEEEGWHVEDNRIPF